MIKLYIGNKNYSSWSMRPWVMLRQAGIAFEEVMVPFGADFAPASAFKQTLANLTPAGKVPLLTHSVDGATRTVYDSLAIAEYAAEQFPEAQLWPKEATARAQARSICAEMHSGFGSLRSNCPMNIEASLPEVGAIKLRDVAGLSADLERITSMWSGLLAQHGGPMLFGDFGIADAYFSPVVMRIKTYGFAVRPEVAAYMARVQELAAVREWVQAALAEHRFVPFDEPYRAAP